MINISGDSCSPDTIVPNPGNPQALNRYSYVLNNPLKYTDPSGHSQCVECIGGGAGGGGFIAIGANAAESGGLRQALTVTMDWLQRLSAVLGPAGVMMAQNADKLPAARDVGNAGGGNTGDPGGLDPNKWDPSRVTQVFRNAAERYQYQTSGTRFGQETRLNINVEGMQRTVDVDGIVNGYLHESKFVDTNSAFYSKQIGQLDSGLQLHITGWTDELQRLSIAAQQHGFQGVKVFVNDQTAIKAAIDVFGSESWFKYIEFIYQVPK